MNDEKQIVVGDTKELQSTNAPINHMLQLLEKNVDVDKIEKLLEIQERFEANEAKKAYFAARADFKKNAPIIEKDTHVKYKKRDGTVVEYDHASLGGSNRVICEALSEYGLSANWFSRQDEGKVFIKCVLSHVGGHSEETEMSSEPDTSGGKNSIQAIGSATTYLQRYTLLLITGLTAVSEEDDGRGTETEILYVGQAEINQVMDMCADLGVELQSLVTHLEIDSLDKMTTFHYKQAIKDLTAKRKVKQNADNN